MKKIILTFALLIIGLVINGQTEMSNYEKYLLSKEKSAIPDTIVKYDTVYVEQEKPEYDDLYFQAKKDELKVKSKELRLEKKKIRMEQSISYYDAKQEVYNDLFYTSMIYRFHRPYSFSYYRWYMDPFYDPWFFDSWYWNWGSSYYYGFYPYHYNYWSYPYYYQYDWRYRPYYVNNYYTYNNFNRYSTNNVTYGRRDRLSTMTSVKSTPVIINKTIQLDKRSGAILNSNINTERRIQINDNQIKPIQDVNKRVSTINKPQYNSVERRSYTPSYTQPKLNTRPQYNNTTPNRTYIPNNNRYNYTLPQERRSSTINSQQNRSAVTPSISIRRSSSTYSSPSSISNSYNNTNRSTSGSTSNSSGSRRK